MTDTFSDFTVAEDGSLTIDAPVVPEPTLTQVMNLLVKVDEDNQRILQGLHEVWQITGNTAGMLQSVQTVAAQMNGPMGAIARKFMGGGQ